MTRLGSILLCCVALASAAVWEQSSSFRCALRGQCLDNDWTSIGRASPSDLHSIIIAVEQQEEAAATCDSLLKDVSYPDSPLYGQHLSMAKIKATFSVPASAARIESWLIDNGVQKKDVYITQNADFIRVSASVSKIEELFGAELYNFRSERAGKTIKRALEYSLPAEMEEHIDFVGGFVRFPPVHPSVLVSALRAGGNVSPNTIQTYYGINNETVTNNKATQALFESLGQSFSGTDLATFQRQFGLPNFPVGSVIGPNDPSQCTTNPNNCGEANLDVQYITAIGQMSPTTYWSIAGDGDIFTEWATAVADDTNPPLVHSISYGSVAREDDSNDMKRFNLEACKLGLRGLTIVIASGDDGVANFVARDDASQCGFDPSFPATSPYVTAVGATQGPEAGLPEIACTSATGGLITTGGGFSITFDTPDYQTQAVKNYLKNGPNLPPLSQFNPTGRAYPDVAMLGHNYQIVIGGQTYVGSGTSASTPVFAGVITLINNARLNANKAPLGFINPALYQLGATHPSIYNDITSGENNCCAGNPGQQVCCQYGFNATTGWDPVTGWGSVHYANFKAALFSL